jgi:hypothetical protein
MKIELEYDAPSVLSTIYASYLKATNRDDSRYQAIADTFKKKPVKSAQIITTEPSSSRDIPAKHSSL